MRNPTDLSRRQFNFALAAGAAALAPQGAFAQAWPAGKAISLMVGYPPGGSVDLVARIVAEPLSRRLGTPVVVENVGGAGGTIAAQKVVNAQPDGYTLLLGSGSEVSIARLFNTNVRYNGETDLSPIGMIGITPMVFVAGPSAGVKTLDEALTRIKREPNRLSFASAGVGTPLHMAGELINLKAGVAIRHVPYRGAGAMLQDVLGGNVEFGVFVLSSALPHIETGKLIPLAVTTPKRSASLPQVPSLAEHPRLKGYDMNVWFGLFGPAKLPATMVTRLNTELNTVLRDKDVWQKLVRAGVTNDGGTPQQLAAFIHAETQRVRQVVNQAVSTGATS